MPELGKPPLRAWVMRDCDALTSLFPNKVPWRTGAQELAGRRFLSATGSAPAPGPSPQGGASGAARDPKAADLLFVLSASQVCGMGQLRSAYHPVQQFSSRQAAGMACAWLHPKI